jgi:hypothetical protein
MTSILYVPASVALAASQSNDLNEESKIKKEGRAAPVLI